VLRGGGGWIAGAVRVGKGDDLGAKLVAELGHDLAREAAMGSAICASCPAVDDRMRGGYRVAVIGCPGAQGRAALAQRALDAVPVGFFRRRFRAMLTARFFVVRNHVCSLVRIRESFKRKLHGNKFGI